MTDIEFMLKVLTKILYLEFFIFILMILGLFLLKNILKSEGNAPFFEGATLVIHIIIATILIIWILFINSFIILSVIFLYYVLIVNFADFNVIKIKRLLFHLILVTVSSDYTLYKHIDFIISRYIKNKKIFTDRYISFLVKFMTAFTLFITGIYTMINDFSFWGIIITTVSLSTVILSVIELIRLIQNEEWK